MATAGGIRAGKAYIEAFLDKTQLEKGLRGAQAKLQSFGKWVAVAGTAVTTAFVPAIMAASNMQEVLGKFDVVFGDNAKEMRKWGDEFAEQVGRSERQVAEFLAGTQDLFIPLGFEPGAAEEMSKTVTKLAVDLASFNNQTDADAMRDLQAALTGSGEVMKKYGVIVSEAAVKQELLNQGLDPKNATNQEKVMARLNIILAGTTAAQGDAIRTSDSFANRMKAMSAQVENLQVAIGDALLPVVTPLVKKVADLAKVFGDWAQQNTVIVATVFKIAAGTAALGGALLGAAGAIKVVLGAIVAYRTAVKAAAAAQAFLTALAGPKGWAIVGIAAAAAGASVIGFNYAMSGLEEEADKAAVAMQEAAGAGEELGAALPQAGNAAEVATDSVDDFQRVLADARTPAEKLADEINRLNALFLEHDPKNEHWDAYAASVNGAINASTGIFDAISAVNDEIGLLTGELTEADIALRKFQEAGLDTGFLEEQMRKRDALKEKKEREEADKSEADRIRESVQTPEERFEAEKKRLERLRPQLGMETFERAMAAAQERFEKESAIGEGAKTFDRTVGSFGAQERGSSGAVGAIARAINRAGGAGQKDPQEKLVALAEQRKRIEELMRAELVEIARNTREREELVERA